MTCQWPCPHPNIGTIKWSCLANFPLIFTVKVTTGDGIYCFVCADFANQLLAWFFQTHQQSPHHQPCFIDSSMLNFFGNTASFRGLEVFRGAPLGINHQSQRVGVSVPQRCDHLWIQSYHQKAQKFEIFFTYHKSIFEELPYELCHTNIYEIRNETHFDQKLILKETATWDATTLTWISIPRHLPPSSFLRTSTGGFLRRLTTNWFEKVAVPLSKMEKNDLFHSFSKNSHYDNPKILFLPIGVFVFPSWNRPRASHLIGSLCECLTQNVLPSQASSLLKNRYIHNASSKPDWNLLKQFHIPIKNKDFDWIPISPTFF